LWAAGVLLLAPVPALAQGLPLKLDLNTGQGLISLSTSADLRLINDLTEKLPLNPNITITLNVELPSGFTLNSASCPDGVSLVNLGNSQYGLSLDTTLPVGSVLSCTLDTLNALQSTVETIVPVLARNNNFLMSLDLGLERQIDLLMPDNGTDSESSWGKSYGLGGPPTLGFMGGSWAASRVALGGPTVAEPSSYSFATSRRQAQRAGAQPPYRLGAKSGSVAPPKPKFDVWAEGYIAHFEDDTGSLGSDGYTGVLYVGADYLLTPQLLIGTLVQFDDTEQDFATASESASTTGWMAGPYATMRLPSSLFLQVRAAWGQSDNEINLGQGPEAFDTDRWLVKGTLLGQWRWGPWQLQPRASVGYIEEDQDSYTSANNVLIPSQTVSLGQSKAGAQLAYRQRMAGGTVIEPNVLLEGIWNFHQDAGDINIDDLITTKDVRGRAEAGVTIYAWDGIALGASVSYDGIGSSDYEAIGGRARVRVPFNN
jgi:outer membrane autotransporter protein